MKAQQKTNPEKLMKKTAQSLATVRLQIERMEQGKLKSLKEKEGALKAELRALVSETTPDEEKRTLPVQQGQVTVGAKAIQWKFLPSASAFRARFHNELGDSVIDSCFKADITRLRAIFKGRSEENDASLFEKTPGERAVRLKLTD